MAMRRSGVRLSLLAGRAVGAALRPVESTALYSTSSDSRPVKDHDYLLGTLPETMKAAVLWEPKKPMTIEELKMPIPQVGEVLIRTKGEGSYLARIVLESVVVFAGSMLVSELVGSLSGGGTNFVSGLL